MTDNLLQKLEDKVIKLITEMEVLRETADKYKQENLALRAEHASYAKKLEGLILLLDSMEMPTNGLASNGLLHHTTEMANA